MMLKVFCPKSGREEWANPAGKDPKLDPRCTKCGDRHPALWRQATQKEKA
jgi:hypothetical protein